MQEKYDALVSDGVVDGACSDLQDTLTWISSLDESEKSAGSSKNIDLRSENPEDIHLFVSASFGKDGQWSAVAYNLDTLVLSYLYSDSKLGVRAAFDNSDRMLEKDNLWPLAVNEVEGSLVVSKVDDIQASAFPNIEEFKSLGWDIDSKATCRFAEEDLRKHKGRAGWIEALRASAVWDAVYDSDISKFTETQRDYLKERLGDRTYGVWVDQNQQDGMGN